jgi:hypothetical protein
MWKTLIFPNPVEMPAIGTLITATMVNRWLAAGMSIVQEGQRCGGMIVDDGRLIVDNDELRYDGSMKLVGIKVWVEPTRIDATDKSS